MFDGVDFPRKPPERRRANENGLAILIFVFALAMLIMPISLSGMVDIIRYIGGR